MKSGAAEDAQIMLRLASNRSPSLTSINGEVNIHSLVHVLGIDSWALMI